MDMASLRLSTDDPDWAVSIFSRAPSEFFQKLRNGTWTIEGLRHSMVVYRWGTRIPARKMQEYVREAGELAAEFSQYLENHVT